MASLGSGPRAPTPPPIYIPVYNPPSTTPADTGPTPEQEAANERRQNLLRRERGRFGTVQTSFRGLLDLAGNLGARKTLLGE